MDRAGMMWWVQLQLTLGKEVLVVCKEEDDPQKLAERCRPPKIAMLSSKDLENGEWDFLFDNGAKLTVRSTRHVASSSHARS